MKAVVLNKPGGFDNIAVVDIPAPAPPAAGELRVRLGASSINYHDLGIITGRSAIEESRILLKDGAGIVESVGPHVEGYAVGDMVIGLSFPTWQKGPPMICDFSTSPGDGLDGFACEAVTLPHGSFHPCAGWLFAARGRYVAGCSSDRLAGINRKRLPPT